MKLQSKNYEILNKQKLRKKIYIYLPLTCFLFRNSLTAIYSRTIISSSSGMSCKSSVSKIAAEFSLTGNSISRRIFGPTLSCRAIEVSWNVKFLSRYPARSALATQLSVILFHELPLSTRAYFMGRAYIKIILKNHARSYFAGRSFYRGNTVTLQQIWYLKKKKD